MRLASPDLHAARHRRLRETLRAQGFDGLLVTSAPNIAYLTGLFASAGALLVEPDGLRLIVDGRYIGAARERETEIPGLTAVLVSPASTYEEAVASAVARLGGRIGFEADNLTVGRHQDLSGRVAVSNVAIRLDASGGIVETLRAVKDAWEISTLREAAARLSDAAKCIIPKVLSGMSERGVAGIIEAEIRRVGLDGLAFDTIVAAGSNSALPHHRAGDRILETGDLVVLDFGGLLNGYAVDLARTITLGRPGGQERRLMEQVAEAQAAGMEAVSVGRAATAVDEAARRVLDGHGLGDLFTHGTGHGLGLEVHERPRVGRWRAGQADEALEAGMVFTIEPGVYLSGWGGVRIEDDVVVTATGAECLTDVPRLL